MKISVVIPAHNEESSIKGVLENILRQDYTDYEVIVVDNASTDKTAEIANSFDFVKVVHEPRKGLCFARERGRKEASGEILANLDADCLPPSNWLSTGVSFFEDPKIVAVTGPCDFHDGTRLLRFFFLWIQKTFFKATSVLIQSIRLSAVLIGGNNLIRASVLAKAGGFNEKRHFWGEDTDTAKRLARFGKIVFTQRLTIKTSARRFKKEGLIKVTLLYLYHFFKVSILSLR